MTWSYEMWGFNARGERFDNVRCRYNVQANANKAVTVKLYINDLKTFVKMRNWKLFFARNMSIVTDCL